MKQPTTFDQTTLPKFKPDTREKHLRNLQKRINSRIKNDKATGVNWIRIKTCIFPIMYATLYFLTLQAYPSAFLFYLGYFTMGILLVFIFLTVIHEVSHDNVFKSKSLNRFFLYFFDLLGANSFIWKKRHELMHHNFPNMQGWDTDIEQSSLFKIYPTAPHSRLHDYQHYLMFLLYPLYLFNWLIIRDFKDYFSSNSTIKKSTHIPLKEYIKLIFFKSFYILYMFIVPIFLFNIPFLSVFTGFLVLTFSASVFALAVLLPPHANITNEFPIPDLNQQLTTTWFEHQLRTTTDISNNNWFISFFMGNFNYHVAHHLFPHLSYAHMKIATEEIAVYATENGFSYRQYPFWKALHNHYLLVKQNAMHASIFEETF
mgnify:CR=1 FL=1|tara:strand:+ start:28953 stop:30068 length:1116 start_codon:yes stop_codon:yes gene_type:complete